jgi:hypothetical protein
MSDRSNKSSSTVSVYFTHITHSAAEKDIFRLEQDRRRRQSHKDSTFPPGAVAFRSLVRTGVAAGRRCDFLLPERLVPRVSCDRRFFEDRRRVPPELGLRGSRDDRPKLCGSIRDYTCYGSRAKKKLLKSIFF